MIDTRPREECCGCASCEAACPVGAISMERDPMGFLYPKINHEICTRCGLCDKICAFHDVVQRDSDPEALAVRFCESLRKSQSGGLSAALVKEAISRGWVVYGAAFREDWSVSHKRAETLSEAEGFRRSKYVQSDMEGIPSAVLSDLKSGRNVLFTGTPCQCAGIASLAGEKYRERLFLADIVCHGTPSPAVWLSALRRQEKKAGEKVTGVTFRDVEKGWHSHVEAYFFGDKKQVDDAYTYLFYQHMILRPSCGSCPFSSLSRTTDLTMADCWGIERVSKDFASDDRGCSLCLIGSEKGRDLLEAVLPGAETLPLDVRKVMQPNLEQPSDLHPLSSSIENDYLRRGLDYVIRRYGNLSLRYRLDRFVAKVKRHL